VPSDHGGSHSAVNAKGHVVVIRDQISADESEKGQVEALGVEDAAKLKAQLRLFVLRAVRGVESLLAAELDAATAAATEPLDAESALEEAARAVAAGVSAYDDDDALKGKARSPSRHCRRRRRRWRWRSPTPSPRSWR
jgi:hypothetical protein